MMGVKDHGEESLVGPAGEVEPVHDPVTGIDGRRLPAGPQRAVVEHG